MKRLLTILAILLSVCANAESLKLAHIFSDHMVLQRETSAPIWGWGEAGKTVTISTSWNFQTMKTTVGEDGTWRVNVATGKAGGPYTIGVTSGKDKLEVKDVMLGEVWICSGQSNMEMPVNGFGFQKVEGSAEAILDAFETKNMIRVFDIKTWKRTEPEADVTNVWQLSTPRVAANTSAIAYFFAKRLTKALGVPVGIIVNSWGGSRIEAWMTRESIEKSGITKDELAEIYAVEEKPDRWPETPELIWNGRVYPILGYAAKGFLWYQGCSNIGQKFYDKLQTSMLNLWRKSWGRGDMPFIYATLAPYDHGDSNGRWRPHFVRTQLHAQEMAPNTWAVCLETLGDRGTIHPAKKKEVADLMFMRAYASVYGEDPGMTVDYPEPKTIEFLEDGRVKIKFTNVWSNLMSITARDVVGFELAGEDRNFVLAKAEVDWDGETVIVKADEVPHPVAVRYGFRNWMGANLQTSLGMPVPPFRSDDWDY